MFRFAAARAVTAALIITTTGWLSGCSSTVTGFALPAPDAAPAGSATVPPGTVEPAAESTVSATDLPALLAGPADIGPLVGASGLVVVDSWGGAAPLAESETVSDPACLSAAYLGTTAAYQGSGYMGLAGQRVTEGDGSRRHIVDQVLTSFHSAGAAAAFVWAQTTAWHRCSGHLLTRHFATLGDEAFTVGEPAESDNGLSVVNYQEGGNGWACSHALRAKANVVVELQACAVGALDQGVTVRDQVITKVAV